MKLPSKSLERSLLLKEYEAVCGVDEVGIGCLAGPVVVCAAIFHKDFFKKNHTNLTNVRDSKLLNAKQRETYTAHLKKLPGISYAISLTYPEKIDRINIYQAARAAMRRSIKRLVARSGKLKTIVLVDGPAKIQKLELPQIAITKGDRKIFAIACASIIAKTYRDRMMTRYAKKFPDYGFELHKGYGTPRHLAALARYGPSPIHRNSFTPVKESKSL